jgi:hypothetical protein
MMAFRTSSEAVQFAMEVTDRVQRDYDRKSGKDSGVRFIPREVPLKSFGKETILFVATPELAKARRNHFEARTSLLRAGRTS